MHWCHKNGRGGQIRTADLSHPKGALYHAELRPDTLIVPYSRSTSFPCLYSSHTRNTEFL